MREIKPEVRRQIVLWIVQAALGMVGCAVLLFLIAGTWRWVWGWAQLLVVTAFLAAHPLLLVPVNSELLAEREKGVRDAGVKWWDRWIVGLAGGLPFVAWIVAALDLRLGWSAGLPAAVHWAGLVVMVLGYAQFLWAMVSNAFFAEGVRIQEERGHNVCTSGPYHYVRHPGYVGSILSQLASPIVLGSLWALIPTLMSNALFVLRTYLEDKTLMRELPGYPEYAQKTRYRLLPGVW